MHNHRVRIVNRKMLIGDNKLNAQSRNSDAIDLMLDTEWDGLDIYCVLFNGDNALVCKYEGEPLVFPDEAYNRGDAIPLSIVGMSDNGVRITVTNDFAFSVEGRV